MPESIEQEIAQANQVLNQIKICRIGDRLYIRGTLPPINTPITSNWLNKYQTT
ncbi:hypothetical protein IQ238_23490 [Pleurocapsales cyanobacterium LEGE 06147]|nr:hypothetical protein [Pleurocapsales cyanobacterium LEGE 06147]